MTDMDLIVGRWMPGRSTTSLARNILSAITRLADIDAAYERWYLHSDPPSPRPGRPFTSSATVEEVLSEGIAGPDLPGNEEAFIFGIWNGRTDDRSAGLNVQNGVHLPFEVQPGEAQLSVPSNLSPAQVVDVVRTLAEDFHPDIAALTDTANLHVLRDGRAAGPVIYFANSAYDIGHLPPEVAEELTDAPGRLFRAINWTYDHEFDVASMSELDDVITPRASH